MKTIMNHFFLVISICTLAGCASTGQGGSADVSKPASISSENRSGSSPAWESTPRPLGPGTGGQLWIGASESVSLIQAVPDEKGSSLIYRNSHNEGQSFGRVIPVNKNPGEVSAHGENNPQLRMGPGIGIFTTFEGGRNIQFARSMSFGHSFLPPVKVNDDNSDAYHSFFTMEVSPRGEIFIAWIDGRDKAIEPPGQSSIYIARSTDQGATFGPNIKVAGNICPCCRPSLTFGPDNTLYMTWRRVFSDNNRMVVVASSNDNGQTWSQPIAVSQTGWKVNGCPHSGPTITSIGNQLIVVWYSAADNKARLLMSRSLDGGKTFESPKEINGPVLDPNHPHITRVGNKAWVMIQGRDPNHKDGWGPAAPWLIQISSDGTVTSPQQLPNRGNSVLYPQLFPGNGGRVYALWTEVTDKGPQVVLCRGRR